MRGAHELDGAVVVEPGQRHVEADRDRERAVVAGAEADRGVDRDGVGVDLLAARDRLERALEAGGVADGEELLGVRPAALAAELGRRAQLDVERAVGGRAVAGVATAGDGRVGRVEDLHRQPAIGREMPAGRAAAGRVVRAAAGRRHLEDRQLEREHRDEAARGVGDRLRRGVVGVREHERQAVVGLLAQRHRQRHLAEQRDVELVGQRLAAALAEDRVALARRA